jgi:hypothetical protein
VKTNSSNGSTQAIFLKIFVRTGSNDSSRRRLSAARRSSPDLRVDCFPGKKPKAIALEQLRKLSDFHSVGDCHKKHIKRQHSIFRTRIQLDCKRTRRPRRRQQPLNNLIFFNLISSHLTSSHLISSHLISSHLLSFQLM